MGESCGSVQAIVARLMEGLTGPDQSIFSARQFISMQAKEELAASGTCDVLAHPDLVKVWGGERPLPEGDLRRYYELAMEGIAESGIAVEVSTAGLRKRVAELYPAPAFLSMALEAGAPVALSSDAHRPEDVGADYDRALELLQELGVHELSVFERRVRRMEPLG